MKFIRCVYLSAFFAVLLFCPAARAAEVIEASMPVHFKNIENLKFSIKKLKNMFVVYSTAYNQNDKQLKNFISDLVSCLQDCEISAMESAGLSESLAETVVKLKLMHDGQKRVYDQFVRVLDEAYIKRALSNKIVADAEKVAAMISKEENAKATPDNLIYKYYGVNAKGHAAHKIEKENSVIRGKSSFFGAEKGDTEQIINKYNSEQPEKHKKITAMEFMDPAAARESLKDAAGGAVTDEKKGVEAVIKEKNAKKTE